MTGRVEQALAAPDDPRATHEAAATLKRALDLAWIAIGENYATSGNDIIGKLPLWNALADLESSLRKLRTAGDDEWGVLHVLVAAAERTQKLEEALVGVQNAYGCFAGCTGALPGAPADGSGHTIPCADARAALASVARDG